MTLLSMFKRQAKPPVVVETAPLPPPSSRREKEAKWFASISPAPSSAAVAAKEPRVEEATGAGDALRARERSLGQLQSLKPMSSSASLRSTGTGRSHRSFWRKSARPAVAPPPSFEAASSGVDLTPRRAIVAPPRPGVPAASPLLSVLGSPPRATSAHRTSAFLAATPTRPSRPPALATIPSPGSPDVTTKSLATRLQELATSNADGLLDDDEYRMLRAQLFDKYAAGTGEEALALGQGAESVPRLAQARHTASVSAPSTPQRRRDASPPPALPAMPRAHSLRTSASRTRTSVGSIFRKSSSAKNLDADWDLVESARVNYESGTNGVSDRASRVDALLMEELQPIRPRSVTRHPGMASVALNSHGAGVSSRSSNGGGSVFSSEGGSFRPHSAYAASSRRGTTLPSSPSGRSHVESISWAPPSLPPMATSTDPFLFATADATPTSTELKTEIAQIEAEWARVGEAWAALEDGAVQKWEAHLGPVGLQGLASLVALRSASSPAALPAADTKRLSRKLSFTYGRSTSSGLKPSPSTSASRPRPRLAPAFVAALESPLAAGTPDEVAAATLALRMELTELAARRRATEDKYEKRLEFLRAKLRGALIREKLPR